MAFQVSPGVLVKEIDLTNIVPTVSTSIGAMAGSFNKALSEKLLQLVQNKNWKKSLAHLTQITLRHGLQPPTFYSMATH